MKLTRTVQYIYASVIILAGAIFWMRSLSVYFDPAVDVELHPVYLLCTALMIAGIAWFCLFLILRKSKLNIKFMLPILLLCGLGFRLIFLGTQPVYENDYKRYLWDGAVMAAWENPYTYSPAEVLAASQPGASSVPSLARLAVMSNGADALTAEINSPVLTTIYPPAAQAVFAVAHWIAPYKKWGLQLVFLIAEILGLLAILAGLKARGQPLIWSALYWLNPIIIFTTYNGIHMDVLLVAPIIGALLAVRAHPIRAACLLSLAAAVKIWPLLLAPVLFRNWRTQTALYIGIAALIAALTFLSLLPMLMTLNDQSGLSAYSANWTNSSFLFPGLRDLLGIFTENSDRLARYVVALILTIFSLWLGFVKTDKSDVIPSYLMILTGAFVLLSPTGYPWYFIWFFMFLPFAAQHWSARGLAFLTIGAAVYYSRFQIGEAGNYEFYAKVLLSIEFGLALLILSWDRFKERANG